MVGVATPGPDFGRKYPLSFLTPPVGPASYCHADTALTKEFPVLGNPMVSDNFTQVSRVRKLSGI